MPTRLGLPDVSNIAGQYRLRADQIADGEIPRPKAALLIEVDANGVWSVESLGEQPPNHRETVAFLTNCIQALAGAVRSHNACASN